VGVASPLRVRDGSLTSPPHLLRGGARHRSLLLLTAPAVADAGALPDGIKVSDRLEVLQNGC